MRQRRLGLLFLRVDDIEPALRRRQGGARFISRSCRFLVIGVCLLIALGRRKLVGSELAVAGDVELGACHLGVGRCYLGHCLRDHRFL